MNTLWQNVKVYSKLTVISVILVYALAFIYQNSNQAVTFWWWYKREWSTSVLFLAGGAFLAGVLSWVLFRMFWKTLRQLRQVREKNKAARLEREMAEMRAKAAKLQTRPGNGGSTIEPLSDRLG
jgi:uncharacterized integral membrane protein